MKITDGEETKWETLDSVYLIRRPWLTARRDTVKLANGIVNVDLIAYYVSTVEASEITPGEADAVVNVTLDYR